MKNTKKNNGNYQHDQTEQIRAYNSFAGEIAHLLGKEWDRVQDQVDAGFKYLEHIPADAYADMRRLALNWDSWPRNWPKAVRELYQQHKAEQHNILVVTECRYCNGNGFFSGSRAAEYAPGNYMTYVFTWRCAACQNWAGKMTTKLPAVYPLEVKTAGYRVRLFGRPVEGDLAAHDLSGIVHTIGVRLNPKLPRPEVMPVKESWEDE